MIRTRGLALDLGGTTGWAADNPDGSTIPLAGIWDTSHADDDLGEAFAELQDQLTIAILDLKPAYVAYEAALPMMWGKTNKMTSQVLYGFGGVVELTGKRLGVRVWEVNLSTARRYFTGNGRASKSDVWNQCRLLKWPDSDLNLCDALCVLSYSRSCFGAQLVLGQTLSA